MMGCNNAPRRRRKHHIEKRSTFPVRAFNVVVHTDGQFMPSALPASFEHFTSVGGFHAGTKAVHTQTAANFGLVGTLRHATSSSLKKIL
jgi:hypothetical protein